MSNRAAGPADRVDLRPYRDLVALVTAPLRHRRAIALVRPDGYLAAVGTADDTTAIRDYLQHLAEPRSPPPTPSNWSTRRIVSRSSAIRRVDQARGWCSSSASQGPTGVPVPVSSRASATVNPRPRQPTRSAAHLRAIDSNQRPATASPRRTPSSGATAPDIPETGAAVQNERLFVSRSYVGLSAGV